jgi:hypothetical protein
MDFAMEKGPGRVVLVDFEREASLVGEEVGMGVGVEVGERSLRQGREERGRSMLVGDSSAR